MTDARVAAGSTMDDAKDEPLESLEEERSRSNIRARSSLSKKVGEIYVVGASISSMRYGNSRVFCLG